MQCTERACILNGSCLHIWHSYVTQSEVIQNYLVTKLDFMWKSAVSSKTQQQVKLKNGSVYSRPSLQLSPIATSENCVRTTGKKTVNALGDQVYYEQQGSGKHAILCLAGALGVTSHFSSQLEYFGRADSPYTIVAYDPMGYGSSRPPERNYVIKPELPYERDASDGYVLMNSLSLPKCSVLGWCSGGFAGVFFAVRYPEAVKKLVIWGSKAYYTEEDLMIYERIRDISTWGAQIRQSMEKIYGETDLPKKWASCIDCIGTIYKDRNGDVCQEELSKIKCPTLIIHGAKDSMCPPSHAEYLHRNIAGSKLVIMPEGKHNLHLKFPLEFNKMVEEFLAE